ncbi:LysR family transcriptional regulator [Providencia rustigianii]|uniref:LysR substrate binding domain protein n=2 Tax=Providencia rustigianii TaxID=158850 RepID=D1P1L2_9GAMM|nr:LysR family transcriptional regulator [Providencia rustigianii]EFB72798.1 LysR substrate binding domain protein [Providencia rustigianii DSM 4541]SUC28387.1 D-malate degradation protein R [Providencia rustigianii]SUC36702.1 D-malate degradation protein R [Providencia rustigianii]
MQKNLKQITSFLQVVDSGSFTKAAEILGLSRSMVSIDIKQLEQRLNVSLLTRNTRNIALTEVGKHFYDDFKRIQLQIEEAFEKSQNLGLNITGTLRFSSTNEFGQRYILPLLPEFCRLYPKLHLQYTFNSSLDDLISEKLDIAIRLGNLKSSSLKVRKLGEYAIHLVATPQFARQYPIVQISDLAEIPWITHSLLNWQDTEYFLQNNSGEKFELPLINSQYSSNSAEVIHQMALASLGVAICPDWLVEEDIKHNRLIRLLPEFSLPKRNIQLLYPNTSNLPAKTRAFIEFLVGKLKE